MSRTLRRANVTNSESNLYAAVDGVMARFDYRREGLVEVLMAAQEAFGHLSKELLIHVSNKLRVPLSQVYGVATFYDMFTMEEGGQTECTICTGPACTLAGAADLLGATTVLTGVAGPGQSSSDGRYHLSEISCLGLCDQAPAALINKRAQVELSAGEASGMLHGKASRSRLRISGEPRVLTGPIGRIGPTDLDAHRAEEAFKALDKALHDMTPQEVISEVKESRLTGRGGAAFPTGLKWELARKAPGATKYVVCNFDESEPGTFKDRVLMEGNPFRVIEGMIIGGYATGSDHGYIFTRGEYAEASEILEEALDELYREHLLGDHILGTEYSFDVELRHNAGAYICGEETALFQSIEGKRGHPRMKPPYPTQAGLFGKPTSINNVETLAVVPSLVLHGGEWFRQWGTAESVGIKLFCLSGHVKEPGVVEVPLGMTIRAIVERYGGGFDGDPQAVLVGGAAGGFLRPDQLDVPLAHEDLRPLNVPIGSGAIIVFNLSVDLWQVLEGLARFFVRETCGRCAPCRLGTKQIHTLLHRINAGDGSTADVRKIGELGSMIRQSCVCGLGMTAANPALTVLHNVERAL